MAAKEELFEAIRTDDIGMVKRLVRQDPSLVKATNDQGVSALLYARYVNRIAALDAMLEVEPELDIFEAVAAESMSRLTELLEADPTLAKAWSADGFTPLHYAAFFGNETAVGLLLTYGAEVNVYSRNDLHVMPLHSACAARHIGIVKLLLEHGAEVNAKQQGGYTPLHEAAQHGDKDLVDILLKAGADPDARLDSGQTPADLARQHGHDALGEILDAY
jgi:ankyrin repeat protein